MSFAIRDFLFCIGFLSRIPMPQSAFEGRPKDALARYVALFPLAGLAIALPAALVALISALLALPPMVAALLIIGAEIIVTGALHEDGLADCADGYYGGHDKARRLEIMKDSAIGSYGTLALVLSIGLRVACIAALWAVLSPITMALIILALGAASRGAMAFFWPLLPAARPNGLAASSGMPDDDQATFALGVGAVFFTLIAGLSLGLWPMLLAIMLAAAAFMGFMHITKQKIGGHTGDSLGAIEAITRMALLVGLVTGL